jgi:hypothetical protein
MRRRGVLHTPFNYTHTILKQPYAVELSNVIELIGRG